MLTSGTQYHSGQELIIDYSLGWGFGNGLTAGVGGYLYQQTTNDTQNGVTGILQAAGIHGLETHALGQGAGGLAAATAWAFSRLRAVTVT